MHILIRHLYIYIYVYIHIYIKINVEQQQQQQQQQQQPQHPGNLPLIFGDEQQQKYVQDSITKKRFLV